MINQKNIDEADVNEINFTDSDARTVKFKYDNETDTYYLS